MRNDLKSVDGVVDVQTDVDNKSVVVEISSGQNIQKILDGVAESNNKLKDWEFSQGN